MAIPRDPQSGPHAHPTKPPKGKGDGKGPNKGKPNKPNKPKFFGGHDGFKGVRVNQASQIINSQIRQLLDGLRDERRDVRSEYQHGAQDVRKRYNRTVGDLEHIFGETGAYIGDLNSKTQEQFQNTQAQAQAAMSALGAALQGNQQQGVAGVNSELSRLGISDPSFINQLNADSAFSQQQASIAGANNMANLGLMSSGASAVGNLLAGMNTGSQSAALGGALNDRNDALAELAQGRNDAMADIRDAMRDARGSRGDLLNQLLLQMQESQWGQFMDAQGLALQRRQLRNQERQAAFARQQANRAYGGSSSGGSSSGGSSGSSSSGGPEDYYSSSNDLLMGALVGGGKKKGKGKGKK